MSKSTTPIVQRLRNEGKTVTAWAKENGYPVRSVRAVISGHNKGHFGQAHKIAVALGLKALPK
jgi:gp16 family phage-associated protein